MEREELKKKITEVLDRSPLGSVATIKDGRPWVRYMMLRHDEDLNCFAATFFKSRKIEQIEKDKNVHVTVGGNPKNLELDYINIQAVAEVKTDIETKKKSWDDFLAQFFSGPEDPDYAVIKISPEVIEYMAPGAHEPEIYTVE